MLTKVYLSQSLPSCYQSEDRTVVYIVPSNNSWNDFGYSLMVEIIVRHKGNEIKLNTGVKAYIDGERNTSAFLSQLEIPVEISSIDSDVKFSTFLGRHDNYVDLLLHTGSDDAREILLAANDIAACRLFAPSDDAYQSMVKTDAIQLSFLRTNEAYLSFIGLKKLFLRSAEDDLKLKLEFHLQFLETVSIPGSLMSLDFEPDNLGPNLIHAFIGRNGLGKTRLLMDIASTLSGRSPPDVDEGSREWVRQVIERNKRRVVVLTHEPARWDQYLDRNTHVKVVPLNVFGQPWIELGQPLFDLVSGSAIDHSDFSWSALYRIARDHLPIEKLHFPRQDGTYAHWSSIDDMLDKKWAINERQFDYTKPIKFINVDGKPLEISSGQKVILTFLTRLYDEAHMDTVYLFDEPEVHLHPQFISLVMLILYDALVATRSIAVISTHSPYVVRELEKNYVTVIKPSTEEGIDFARPTLQTRGANIGAISQFVFEHSNAVSLIRSRLMEFIMNRAADSVHPDLLRDLRGLVGSEGVSNIPDILAQGRNDKLSR